MIKMKELEHNNKQKQQNQQQEFEIKNNDFTETQKQY